jgi:hypothetical protein
MEIIPSIRKILLGKPANEGSGIKRNDRGSGNKIITINTELATIVALTMLQRSLIPTYLHVILYILNPVNIISLTAIKNGNALRISCLYSAVKWKSKRSEKEKNKEKTIIKISPEKKKRNLLRCVGYNSLVRKFCIVNLSSFSQL